MTGRTLLLLAALLAPGAALGRPGVGLRLAFAGSLLEASDRVPMADVLPSQVPLQLDVLWRLSPRFAAGGYASWGFGQVGATACSGASCSGRSLRAGLQAHLASTGALFGGRPWLGAGAGWEWATVRRERLGSEVTTGLSGPEGFVEAGNLWEVGGRIAVGPYLLLAAGRYGETSLEASGGSASTAIADRSVHLWLHAGVRGRIDL